MSYWRESVIDVGKVKENSEITVVFFTNPEVPEIDQIVPKCGCTECIYDKELGQLLVRYKIDKIPPQVEGDQRIGKMIRIFYCNGEGEELFIIGTKIKRETWLQKVFK